MSKGVTVAAVAVLAAFSVAAGLARDDEEYSTKDVEKMIDRADEQCRDFKGLVEHDLGASILKGTRIEDDINGAIEKLNQAVKQLKQEFDPDDELEDTRDEAEDVVSAAKDVHRALEGVTRRSRIHEEWERLKKEIDRLAEAYEQSEED